MCVGKGPSITLTDMSSSAFRAFHALRIKGFANAATVAEVADLPVADVEGHLAALRDAERATFNEGRGLWRLTPAGREAHAAELLDDVAAADIGDRLRGPYHTFLSLNERLKEVCGEWQLKDGQTNDHSDSDYDSSVIAQLVVLNDDTQPVLADIAAAYPRFGAYGRRLDESLQKVIDGETKMFTGVMCSSYHDVWMELHEDLILTQGIDRVAEGSF